MGTTAHTRGVPTARQILDELAQTPTLTLLHPSVGRVPVRALKERATEVEEQIAILSGEMTAESATAMAISVCEDLGRASANHALISSVYRLRQLATTLPDLNILNRKNATKIVDKALAEVESDTAQDHPTSTRAFAGFLHYLPPEQAAERFEAAFSSQMTEVAAVLAELRVDFETSRKTKKDPHLAMASFVSQKVVGALWPIGASGFHPPTMENESSLQLVKHPDDVSRDHRRVEQKLRAFAIGEAATKALAELDSVIEARERQLFSLAGRPPFNEAVLAMTRGDLPRQEVTDFLEAVVVFRMARATESTEPFGVPTEEFLQDQELMSEFLEIVETGKSSVLAEPPSAADIFLPEAHVLDSRSVALVTSDPNIGSFY